MSKPIVTAEQVRYIRSQSCAHTHFNSEPCSICFALELNALLAPIIAERERLARVSEAIWWKPRAFIGHRFSCSLHSTDSPNGDFCDCDKKIRREEIKCHMAALEAAAPKVSESQNAAPGKETGK